MGDEEREVQGQDEPEQNPEENEQDSQKGTRSNTKGCLIIIGVLAALIALIGVCNAFCGTDQPAQNEQARPTATRKPTETTVCKTAAAQTYQEELVDVSEKMAESYGLLKTAMEGASNDPTLVFEDGWRLEVGVTLAAMVVYADALEELTPPTALRPVHSDALRLAEETRAFAVLLAAGLDAFDIELVNQAAKRQAVIVGLLDSMGDKWEAICH